MSYRHDSILIVKLPCSHSFIVIPVKSMSYTRKYRHDTTLDKLILNIRNIPNKFFCSHSCKVQSCMCFRILFIIILNVKEEFSSSALLKQAHQWRFKCFHISGRNFMNLFKWEKSSRSVLGQFRSQAKHQ